MATPLEKHPDLQLLEADEANLVLPSFARARILREARVTAARNAARPARLPGATWAAAAAAVVVLVGAGYVWRPATVADHPAAPAAAADGVDLRVSQLGSQVVLEWNDGSREASTLRQATSARAVRQAPGVKVSGNRYVDRGTSESPIVYYLVE